MSETVYAAIDLELTGLKVGSAEIIEIGVVRCTPERVIETWSALARPYGELPLRITRLTGITAEMLSDAPPFEQLADELRALLEGTIPIGHNIRFDIDHLGANGVDVSRQAVDTLPLAQVLDPTAPSHRLGELCERHGIALDRSHRALADAEASRRLLLAMRRRWDELSPPQREYAALANGAMGLASPLRGFLSLVADGALPPRRRELRPAAPPQAAEQGPEPPPIVELPQRSLAELTAAAFDAAAGDAELGMERRESQRAMALDVAGALDDGEQALVEAGTGVGKSLAYLVPAALWAMREGKRVIISTYMRNLQAQLSEGDFRLLRQMLDHAAPALGAKLQATVLKGRGNYLCRRALETALARGLPAGDETAAEVTEGMLLARAGVWAESADCNGDREQLRLSAEFNDSWARLSAERASCLHDGTDHVAAGACFLARAFDSAASAHITVVNHAWLISNLDAARRYRLENDAEADFQHLAESDAVIVDEAHFLEDATTNALRQSVNGDALEKLFDGIRSTDRRRRATLTRRAEDAAPVAAERLADATIAARQAVEAAWFAFEQFLGQFGERDAVVLSGGMRAQRDWSELEQLEEAARRALRGLASELRELARAVEGVERGQLADDARAAADACEEAVEALQLAIEADPAQTVAWLEKQQRRQRRAPEIVSLDSAPIDVSGKLTELLWSRCPRVVLTGATLTVDGQWDFLRRRLGMPEAIEARYDSPFDYERNARIYVAADMPPVSGPPREVEQALANAILALARASEGRTLALFTAHGTMRRVMENVRQPLAGSGIALSVQGPDGSPAQVVDDLRGNPRTVIFGVDSLWTGIDVPGEALSQVIVCRLPFDRPNDPIQSARAEQYENAFVELSVPTAILKLRQGVGRLIRTGDDRGVIVILDNRVATKRYGARFLNELPPAPIEELPIQQIAAEVQKFLPPLPAAQ